MFYNIILYYVLPLPLTNTQSHNREGKLSISVKAKIIILHNMISQKTIQKFDTKFFFQNIFVKNQSTRNIF